MITTALCNSFKQEILDGIHLAADDYRIALYTAAAALSKATTVYSSTDEVVGPGYTAGGQSLTGRVAALDGDTAILDWDDPVWAAASITARGALIYNASRANKAVAVFDFGGDITSTNAPFTITLPPPAAATATVHLG